MCPARNITLGSGRLSRFCFRILALSLHSEGSALASIDSQADEILSASDLRARPTHSHEKHNLLYLSKGLPLLRRGLSTHQALCVNFDEARMTNCQILEVFGSVPLDTSTAHGITLPPQIMPEIFISLKHRKINLRLSDALGAVPGAAAAAGGAAAQGRRGNKVPKSDDLVQTWYSELALDNAMRCFTADGLKHFEPATRPPIVSSGGRYVWQQGAWWVESDDEELTRLCPGIHRSKMGNYVLVFFV